MNFREKLCRLMMPARLTAMSSFILIAPLLLAVVCLSAGCRGSAPLPEKSSKEYREVVSAFYVGLAALQVGDDVRADAKLTEATRLVPEEPASWANLGLLALRQKNLEVAAERLEKANSLAPQNGQVRLLLAILESNRGRFAEAISYLRKAIEVEPRNLKAVYMLAELIERQGDEQSVAEAQRLLTKILEAQPGNLTVLLEVIRIAAKRGETELLRSSVARLAEGSSAWPPEVKEQLNAVRSAAEGPDTRAAATRIAFLRNVLARVPEYRRSFAAVKSPPGEEAEPLTRFLRLETPAFTPAPADDALAFNVESLPAPANDRWDWIGAISMNGEGVPAIITANGREALLPGGQRIPFPGGPSASPPTPEGILGLDFSYDFKTDLVFAGAGGLRLLKQDSPDAFADVTSLAALPSNVTGAAYTGAWAADIEADGDLDIVLGAQSASTIVLRNNGDATFKVIEPFKGSAGLFDFIWTDLDADGDADAALNDAQGLRVYTNERTGQFIARPMPPNLPPMRSLNVVDISGDGILDLLGLQADGIVARISDKDEGREWEVAEVARVPNAPTFMEGAFRLLVADMDNNGALDLILSMAGPLGGQPCPPACPLSLVWLGDQGGSFKLLNEQAQARSFSASDTDADGRLDLLGLSAEGRAVRLLSRGAKNYHWQAVRPRAKEAVGDQRINSFGIGGEMEVRSGLLVQKQPITSPLVHFGLGDQTTADVVRIVWPNGSVRAEFELKADQVIVAEQRLKGSCPFLFADNGREMSFVKDTVPWGSAIGLRIDNLGTASIQATEEWYKIRGDQLVAREGFYDLRVTAELWETYYYDHLSLMVVDHPVGTDIFVDERFSVPPPPLAVRVVATPQQIASARDDQGTDVTGIMRARDEKYLDTFGRGQYQGVTRDHFVEIELGESAPPGGPLWLIAHGWMHPTDSSINVALGQGGHEHARGLSLEVPDGRGGWTVAKSGLGIPAGRNKTILLDLENVFLPGTPKRLRLRTNLEVFWDAIEWATGQPGTHLKTLRLDPEVADLRYRGFSVINQADASSPELPDYNRIGGTTQRWRDLVGYYTRFGDVLELLAKADDRYVLMNAGDEMAFRFPAPPPPPEGWARDYVLVGDGWIKDGDYNSTFSKTVLPLPSHDRREYTTLPDRLEDDPVYRRYPQDWQQYHTRYVTPQYFQNALRVRP
jgi:tetratricopeptide (TPR) repeat protein